VYTIINGTGTLAGEEDNGRLEIIVALPTPRWQLVAVKAVALGVALAVILAITSLGAALTLVAIQASVETQVSAVDLFVSLMAAWPLAMAVGMISLFLGTFCPGRRIASMLAAVVVIVSYLGSNLTSMIESLQSIEWLFLFHFYDATGQGLIEGQRAEHLLILVGVAVAAFGLALFFFQRRNLTVGVWPWQKGRIPADA
jgi:ABC-2 type transport system permease protein